MVLFEDSCLAVPFSSLEATLMSASATCISRFSTFESGDLERERLEDLDLERDGDLFLCFRFLCLCLCFLECLCLCFLECFPRFPDVE